eukprot:8252139-Pyramimonas_sp.AAC.1
MLGKYGELGEGTNARHLRTYGQSLDLCLCACVSQGPFGLFLPCTRPPLSRWGIADDGAAREARQ